MQDIVRKNIRRMFNEAFAGTSREDRIIAIRLAIADIQFDYFLERLLSVNYHGRPLDGLSDAELEMVMCTVSSWYDLVQLEQNESNIVKLPRRNPCRPR